MIPLTGWMIRASVGAFEISNFWDIIKLVNASKGTTGTTIRGETSRHRRGRCMDVLIQDASIPASLAGLYTKRRCHVLGLAPSIHRQHI